MIRLLLILLLILSGCSSEKKEVIAKNILSEKDDLKKKINENFNSEIKISLSKNIKDKSLKEFRNNYGRHKFQNITFNQNKYKFKKVKKFSNFEPNIVFDDKGIIFFEGNGTILKFDYSKNLIWKKNYYSKLDKKSKILINFSSNKKNLIISDNLSNYSKIDLETGELIWSKRSSSRFNSQIKIIGDKFYAIDAANVIYCISLKNGKVIWSYKTENFFIKSNKKLSIIIDNEVVIFSNSVGDITALNMNNGSFIWQTPTQNNNIYADTISLSSSDLVLEGDSLFFSNNNNEFYSLNKNNGFLNWKQNINSDVRPILTDNMIFTVSNEGLLFLIDSKNGNIIKSVNLFETFKEKKRNLLKPVGIVLGVDKLFMTLNNGTFLVYQIEDIKMIKRIKIDNNIISKPFIFNQKIYVAKDNSIIEIE